MSLDWHQRVTIQAPRYARVHDGSMIYSTVLPPGMALSIACEDYASTAKYSGHEGEMVACTAKLFENGKETETRSFEVPCQSRR